MRKTFKIFLLLILAFNFSLSQILSPEKFFGFKMGEDKKLIGWDEIYSYFNHVDKNSDRVIVEELGKTTLGKPFILAIASSEKNIKEIQKLKSIQKQLAKPYGINETKAKELIRDGKVFI